MPSWWSRLNRRAAVLREVRSANNVVLFLSIFGFAALTPLLFRLQLTRLESLLGRLQNLHRTSQGCTIGPSPAKIRQVVAYTDGAIALGRPLIRPGCLTRGLTLYHFLRGTGLDVELYFGTGQMDDEFAGHCWLVKNGEPFLEKTDPRPHFSAIYRFPTEALAA